MKTILNQEERKKQLIAQGALYRAEIMIAKDTVRTGLRPQALVRGATEQLAMRVYSTFRHQGAAGLSIGRLQTALPLLITAVSGLMKFTSKKLVLKIVLSSILAAGVTAAVTAAVSRRKQHEAGR
ncbi:hypothetical protein [Noviherbaspirillum sp. Root189]|uniref:hypothetical protein n=1 Tax=Noviherbaspirillum sp. Root189 TaxID=1736487 RepID=UPI000710465F|nr:hypothetical protein [Noviherbaspirillum sp. Root189]KRB94105.1 hypothetical protein ASE07_00775 [Noviherbaspirillum sp. Root189]